MIPPVDMNPNSTISDSNDSSSFTMSNGIVGYKIFKHDWKCLDYQFNVGQEAIMTDEPKLCEKGFHFCIRPLDCLNYYPTAIYGNYHQFAKVIAKGIVKHSKNHRKSVTNRLYIQERLSREEFMRLCTGKTTKEDGTIEYYENGQYHRDGDLPAIIHPDGRTLEYYKYGQLHRDGDLPAKISADGTQEWFQHGNRHRDGKKTAVILPDGSRGFYQNDNIYKGIYANETIEYYDFDCAYKQKLRKRKSRVD